MTKIKKTTDIVLNYMHHTYQVLLNILFGKQYGEQREKGQNIQRLKCYSGEPYSITDTTKYSMLW